MHFKTSYSENPSLDINKFIKLKDGESISGVFMGEPHDFKQHWRENRSVLCTAPQCALCAEGFKPAFRFRLNLIVKTPQGLIAKIFEQSWETWKQLKALHEGEYPLTRTIVNITRKGTGKNTRFIILPSRAEITAAHKAHLLGVKLHDLKNIETDIAAPKSSPEPEPAEDHLLEPPAYMTEEIPF